MIAMTQSHPLLTITQNEVSLPKGNEGTPSSCPQDPGVWPSPVEGQRLLGGSNPVLFAPNHATQGSDPKAG